MVLSVRGDEGSGYEGKVECKFRLMNVQVMKVNGNEYSCYECSG